MVTVSGAFCMRSFDMLRDNKTEFERNIKQTLGSAGKAGGGHHSRTGVCIRYYRR